MLVADDFKPLLPGDWALLIAEHYHGVLPSQTFLEARGYVLENALRFDLGCRRQLGTWISAWLCDGLDRQVAMRFLDKSSARDDIRLTEEGNKVLASLHSPYPSQCAKIDAGLGGEI